MSDESLTKEQKLFLEECEDEFCDRFTDADNDYKLVKECGIPKPPITIDWYPKLAARYRGAGGSKFSSHREKPYEKHYNRHNRDRDQFYNDNYRSGDRRYR